MTQGSAPPLLREAWCMARAELLEMFVGIRALFLVFAYLFATGSMGACVVKLNEKTEGQIAGLAAKAAEASATEKETLIQKMTEEGAISENLARSLIEGSLPPLPAAILFVTTDFILPWLPLLILLVGFNRVSEDLHSRYTRYLLQRVHRGSYLFGKLLGLWLMSLAAVVLVHLVLLGIGAAKEVFDMERTWAAMPKIWLGMAFLTLAYSAYTIFWSSLVTPPFLSLVLAAAALVFLKFATGLLSLVDLRLGQLWLDSWTMRLWVADPPALGIFAGYATLFVAGSWLVLRRRDV